MIKKCNYFRIVAFVVVMLLGTTNTWALGLKNNVLRLRQEGGNTAWNSESKEMTWSSNSWNLWYVEALSPDITENVTGKDLSSYSRILFKLTKTNRDDIDFRMVIKTQDNSEYYYRINQYGNIEIPLHGSGWKKIGDENASVNVEDMLKYAVSVRIGGRSQSGSVKIEEMYICKDVECDASGNITIGCEDLVANASNLYREGDYIRIDSDKKGWVGLGFNFDTPVYVEHLSVYGNLYYAYDGFINNFAINYSSGDPGYPGKAFDTSYAVDRSRKMSGFEVVFGNTGYGAGHVKSVTLKVGYASQSENNRLDLAKTIEVPYNKQKEFSFRIWGRGDKDNDIFSMIASSKVKSATGDADKYFCMDLQPSVTRYDSDASAKWDKEVLRVYGNHSQPMSKYNNDGTLTDGWKTFLSDLQDGAYADLKVRNYDGKIVVYCVIKSADNSRKYVYKYEYDRLNVNSKIVGNDKIVYVYFNVNNTRLTTFNEKNAVGLTTLDCAINYPANTSAFDKTGYVTMQTEEGCYFSRGDKVGEGDNVLFTANMGPGWELDEWSNGEKQAYSRTITISNTHVGGYCNPSVRFKKTSGGPVSGISYNRPIFFDFEDFAPNAQNRKELTYVDDHENGAPGVINYTKDNKDQNNKFEQTNGFYNYRTTKNGKTIEGKIMHDPVFGYYYQNMAVNVDEYTESKSENFLRIVLSDDDKDELKKAFRYNGEWSYEKPASETGMTIGFWVNARIANKYELPLERGSMFAIFSDQKFNKAQYVGPENTELDESVKPRYMFDIACNGWAYSYMPCTTSGGKTYINRYLYGEMASVVDNPKESLFGTGKYTHTQNQLLPKFYDDNEWHYITYVASDGFRKITMYVDGESTRSYDTRDLDDGFWQYEENGDYAGRVWHLRNIVLGGFTPHGLFFSRQFYSDAALAYDDVAIYTEALSQEKIQAIIADKNYSVKSWKIKDYFTSSGGYAGLERELSHDRTDRNKMWHYNWEPFYTNEKALNGQELTAGYVQNSEDSPAVYPIIPATAGLLFTASEDALAVDNTTGLLGMQSGTEFVIPNVPKGYYVHFTVKAQNSNNTNFLTSSLAGVGEKTVKIGDEDFKVITLRNSTNNNMVTFTVQDAYWFESIEVSPYRRADLKYSSSLLEIADNQGTTTYPTLSLHIDSDNPTALSTLPAGSIRYVSSAPQVASVDETTGEVTVHGLAGYATITAELVRDKFDDVIGGVSASYEIRVNKGNTYHLQADSNPEIGVTLPNESANANITITAGGWGYNNGSYQTSASKTVNDGWGAGREFNAENDKTPIDGFNTYSQGQQNAMSENYGLGNDWSKTGRFDPATSATDGVNSKAWTLPCRGSYVKIQPKTAGVLSMYILQNGNLGDENYMLSDGNIVRDGNTQGGTIVKKWCTTLSWRPVYVADETGKIIGDVQVTSNGNISPYDNFFREGRRRAQFIYDELDTWNQELKNSMLAFIEKYGKDRLDALMAQWNNANWKQDIIPSGDGGYMVMSKAMMRYTFNVLPGKTYYIFSNVSKIGISGYNFEEGKCLTKVNGVFTMSTVTSGTVTFNDADYGKKTNGEIVNPSYPEGFTSGVAAVTYNRNFTPGKWGSICLPFSMNNKQMKENFGDETSVVLLKGIDDKGVVQMVWHVNQDIIAGYPYFILPRGKESITQISTNAYFDPTVTAPSFVIGPEMDNGQSATYGSIELLEKAVGKTEYPYVFKGNFATEQATAGSYVMTTSGVLTKASNTPNIKPFRAYLRYCSQIDANPGDHANGKPLSGMGYMNSDGEEVTTSIEQILEANGIFVDSANVYGIDGQVKRYNTHDLNGLPKGIYIVNGKKYVVK